MSGEVLRFSTQLAMSQLRHMGSRLLGTFAGVCVAIVLIFTQAGLVSAVVGSALNLPRALDADLVMHLGHPGLDADVPGDLEARWVGRSRWRKLLWVAAYPMVILFLRTGDVKTQPVLERWTLLNAAAMAAGLVPLIWVFGWTACAYLLLSTLLALGLHPVGGRWFQEHYVVREGQETYSYYGVLNRLCFNMGYHNEHHDFPGVAWSRLPALRRAAPEFYDSLYAHRSWCLLLLRVIFDASFSPANRIVRFDQVRPGSQPDAGA